MSQRSTGPPYTFSGNIMGIHVLSLLVEIAYELQESPVAHSTVSCIDRIHQLNMRGAIGDAICYVV